MVPEEWPIAAPADVEPAESARVSGGDRLSTALTDFFLDPAKRLTEQERALIGALLDGLIGRIADEILSSFADRAVANDLDPHALRHSLSGAGLLQRRDLMAVLLRSADEERIASALRTRFPGSPTLLLRLISSPVAEVSAAAMDLILARGRRRDRFGQPRLEFDDLPARVAGGLAHSVAAALQDMIVTTGSDDDIDHDLAHAATALLGRRDEHGSIDCITVALVQTLGSAGLLDEPLLGIALREGDIRIVAHALALRAQIDAAAAWDLLLSSVPGGSAMLLRMAGVSRHFAAELIAAMGDQLGIPTAAAGIQAFEAAEDERVRKTRAWMQLDPAYRAAAEGLDANG